MPVAFHVAADDGAVENVEGGEQRGCAVAFVVVGHRPGAPRLHRQSRLGAVEGLDLALLVDRENDGVGGRIDVEATMSLSFAANFGSFDSLNVRTRCGASWWASRMRCTDRACQVHTTGFALPDRRMISAVPQPAAVARMIWARHTCFCGAQRSETIASSRWRSARVTLTTIPALMTRA